MRSVLFTGGLASLCIGVGWCMHPGAGLALFGLCVCVPLAWLRVTGRDEE